jgi:dipeptidyl aminopeptidase/acylaminoacyl peptidase
MFAINGMLWADSRTDHAASAFLQVDRWTCRLIVLHSLTLFLISLLS